MNPALVYLCLALLKRKALRFCSDLRRPTRLLGFAAVAGLVGFLFYQREREFFGRLVGREAMIGCALVMLSGSLFTGFLRRGLVFEPADVEFLFTGPFSQRQIIFYHLFPHYLFALVEALVFLGLFESHLARPVITSARFMLFQIICFHSATAMSLFAGSVSEQTHHRVRWLMLGAYLLLTAAYLRVVWDIRLVPAIAASPWAQLLFYPAVTLSDGGMLPRLGDWALSMTGANSAAAIQFLRSALCFAGLVVGAPASLYGAFKLGTNVIETSLATTTRAAERRLRLRHGRRIVAAREQRLCSAALPTHGFFHGVGAVIWKNLLVARRSRRELTWAFVFTLIFTLPLAALLRLHHYLLTNGIDATPRETNEFHVGVALLLGFLPFLLQRTFPFDFRCDGHHLAGLRTLPVSPFALALAEIAVPTGLCLAFQGLGVAALMIYARMDRAALILIALGYPATTLAVNAVWNLHYLLSAVRRDGIGAQPASAMGTLLVVGLSFLIFYPAGRAAVWIFDKYSNPTLAAGGFLAVQYSVDFLLVLALARLLGRFDVSRDGL